MFITYHNTCNTFNTTEYEYSFLATHSWPPRTACTPTCMASRGLVQASGTVRPQRCTASVGGDPGSISTCCAWMLRFIEKAEFHKFQFIECVFYNRYFRVIGYSYCKAFRNMSHENLLPRPGMDQGKSWPEVLRFEWFCGHDTAPGTKTIDLGATWGCCFQSNARHVQKWQAGLPESNLCKNNISFGTPEQNCSADIHLRLLEDHFKTQTVRVVHFAWFISGLELDTSWFGPSNWAKLNIHLLNSFKFSTFLNMYYCSTSGLDLQPAQHDLDPWKEKISVSQGQKTCRRPRTRLAWLVPWRRALNGSRCLAESTQDCNGLIHSTIYLL